MGLGYNNTIWRNYFISSRAGDLPRSPPLLFSRVGTRYWMATRHWCPRTVSSLPEWQIRGCFSSGEFVFSGYGFMLKCWVCIILLKLWTEGLHLVVMWKYKIWCFQHLAEAGAAELASAKYSYGAKLINIIKHLSSKYVHSQFSSERESRVQNEKLFK